MKKTFPFLLLLLIIGCQKQPLLQPYYQSDGYALLQLESVNDSVKGAMILLQSQDSLEVVGTLKDSWFEFYLEPKNHDKNERFTYKIHIQRDSLMMVRHWNYLEGFKDTLFFYPFSKNSYDSIVENMFNSTPVKLITVKNDTIVGDFEFHLKIENYHPSLDEMTSEITIKDVKTQKIIQKIESDRFIFNADLDLNFKDMNFDGYPDLVFFNGQNGGYGTYTYDYYLYNPNKNQFIFNEQLLEIGSCMGLEVDTIQKRIISYAKDGCCWHQEKAYKPSKDKFIEIKSLTEEITTPESSSYILLKYKEGGKWKTYKRLLKNLPESTVDSLHENF